MAQGPQKRPKMFSRRDYGLIIIIVLIVIGFALLISRNSAKPEELTQNDFWSYIDNDQVVEVTPTPVGSGANAKLYSINGIYRDTNNEERQFIVVIDDKAFEDLQTKARENNFVLNSIEPLSDVDWLSLIFSIGIPIALIIFLVYIFRQSGQGNNKAFDFAKSRARLNRKSTNSFKDVAGADEEKEEMEEIIDFLKYPKKYFEIGARVPKGVLLIGPPGT